MTRPRTISRALLALMGLAVIAQALLLWNATGRARLTRYDDPARASESAPTERSDLDALLEASGVNDGFGAIEVPENRFAFGLLPSTYPWQIWDRHVLSVATVATPALVVVLIALAPSRRKKQTA